MRRWRVILCITIRNSDDAASGGGSAHGLEGGGEIGGKGTLNYVGEFLVVHCQVEDVDGGFAFGVDEGYLDVAFVSGERQRDLAEQAGNVLGDDLQEGRVR